MNKRWIYIAGITLMVVLVGVGYFMFVRMPKSIPGGELEGAAPTAEIVEEKETVWQKVVSTLKLDKIAEVVGIKEEVKVHDAGATVTGWRSPNLFLDTSRGQEKVFIYPLKPVVVIRINEPGEETIEELVTHPTSPYWDEAFCEGDKLEIKWDGEEMKEIRNLGPRSCGK